MEEQLYIIQSDNLLFLDGSKVYLTEREGVVWWTSIRSDAALLTAAEAGEILRSGRINPDGVEVVPA